MRIANAPPRRRRGSHPLRVLILLGLICAGLYVLTVKPELIPHPFEPTITPTRTSASLATEAEALYQQGKLAEAIDGYQLAVQRDPTQVENYVPLVRLLTYCARVDEALDTANTALFVDPEHAGAHAVRALALDWKGNALADVGLDTAAADVLNEALQETNQALESDPTLADAHAYQAEILFDQAKYDQANQALTQALQLDPNRVDVQRVAGYVAENLGYRQEAITAYQQALRLHPKLALLHQALGRTLIGAGEIERALDCLKRAIELEPENATHRFLLGYAFGAMGEQESAINYYRQALELDPTFARARCQLGVALYLQRDWQAAINELTNGVLAYDQRVTENNAFCYFTLGMSHYYAGNCAMAQPLFEQVLQALPENESALIGIDLCQQADAGQDVDTPSSP